MPLITKKKEILERFQKERTDAITDMFNSVDEIGIYPTTKFFARLDEVFASSLDEYAKAIDEESKKIGTQVATADWNEDKAFGLNSHASDLSTIINESIENK